MEATNPDICFQCKKELGKLFWGALYIGGVGGVELSLVWVEHYSKFHPDRMSDLEFL